MSPFLLTRTLPEDATDAALRADVLDGLTRTPKTLPPKWFYDARGSELFERITELPEYYPTRAEREILVDRAGLNVHALIADFTAGLELPETPGPRLVAFLGGTIGNPVPVERAAFLAAVRALPAPGDALLLGTDLVKDEAVLVAAYDDAAGVTAELRGSFILSVVRTARPTRVPKPRQRSRIGKGRTRPASRSRRSPRVPGGPVMGSVPAAAGVARSTRKLRSRHSADVASTEERHA